MLSLFISSDFPHGLKRIDGFITNHNLPNEIISHSLTDILFNPNNIDAVNILNDTTTIIYYICVVIHLFVECFSRYSKTLHIQGRIHFKLKVLLIKSCNLALN